MSVCVSARACVYVCPQKSPGESALMRASADLSAKALIRCIQHTRPGIPEFTIAAMFGE